MTHDPDSSKTPNALLALTLRSGRPDAAGDDRRHDVRRAAGRAHAGNAGKRILVRAGSYVIGQALTVPDDATLVGEGEMTFDDSGLPAGIAPAGRTVLRSTAALSATS